MHALEHGERRWAWINSLSLELGVLRQKSSCVYHVVSQLEWKWYCSSGFGGVVYQKGGTGWEEQKE